VESSRRKVLDREEAEFLLAEWKDSGRELANFARARGIDGRSLHCWRINIDQRTRRTPGETPIRIVELQVASTNCHTRYRIELHGGIIEVDDQFNEQTLERIIRLVRT